MNPVTKRRSNKLRRAESTQAVEKAACRLFVERGFRSTSMDLIAREVGMTKGAVYFYYKDKNALLDEYLLLLPVVMATEFKGRGDTVELAVKDIYEGMYLKLSDIIASGCNNGEFKSELPPRSLATMIVALTDGLLLEIYRQTSGVSGKDIGRAAREMVTNLLVSVKH